MVVQLRQDVFRVIRQHDHALASGMLADAWVGTADDPDHLPFPAILGVALHDCGWREVDGTPRRDPEGGILDFLGHPRAERLRFYATGIDEAERIHPYAGLLASFHYAGFAWDEAAEFRRAERERQARLLARLGSAPEVVSRHRGFVGLFDDLSLFACLAAPGSRSRPEWLLPGDVADAPDGVRLTLAWRDESTFSVSPFPFRGDVELAVPARDLPRRRYADDADVRAAWDAAPPRLVRTRVVPPA